jgi:HD-like signal output (HDOD) protein
MKRVLFVDDEEAVLGGLRRSLRNRCDEWDMVFTTSAAEALALLDGGSFDVLVSDLRMPEMDGVQLLEIVRAKYPGIVRIALSGLVEREGALRASGVVHQYLSKPCDREALGDAIERFCASTAILADEAVRRIVGAVGDLPSLPQTASALVNMLRSENITMGEVAPIIAQDVGMTAKVLRLVNSPLFGLFCEITSLQSALAVIGLDTLRELVLSAEIFRTFELARPIAGFSLAHFEAHSALTSKIAARLPVAKSIIPGSITAAFLHDVGKLVLAVRLPEAFERSLQLSRQEQRPLHEVEAQLIGANHAEIGAYLLSLWGLSRSIVDGVGRHHDPGQGAPAREGLDIAGIIHVADALANDVSANRGENGARNRSQIDRGYLAAQGLASKLPAWRFISEQVARGRDLEARTAATPTAGSVEFEESAEASITAPNEALARLAGEVRDSMDTMMRMIDRLTETDLTPDQGKCVAVLQRVGEMLLSTVDQAL